MPAFSFCVFGIWAGGAFGLLVRKITIYQSYMQFLRKGNTEVSDLETLNILAEAEEKLRIKRAIELFRNPLVTSPIPARPHFPSNHQPFRQRHPPNRSPFRLLRFPEYLSSLRFLLHPLHSPHSAPLRPAPAKRKYGSFRP